MQTNTNNATLRGQLSGVNPFRGLGVDVAGLDVDAAVKKSGLDWKAAALPVAIHGRTEYRKAPGYQGVIRCDTGALLDITSDKFKIHQNRDTVGLFHEMAKEGELELHTMGELDGGAEIFAVARAKGEFTMNVGGHNRPFNGHAGAAVNNEDKTQLHFIMRGGHRPGTPTTLIAIATRLWCMNGVRFTEKAIANFRLTHRNEMTSWCKERIKEVVAAAISEFSTYEGKARRMLATQMTQAQTELYVLDLIQPEISTKIRASVPDHQSTGRALLDRILSADESRHLFTPVIRGEYNRGTKSILDEVVNQPGAVPGTVWNAFNAVTYYVDHVRGRNADSGVRAAIFGDGDRLKKGALDLAVEFTMMRAHA